MITISMTTLMRVKVQYIPQVLMQESLDDQITWGEISKSVSLSESEQKEIGLEEIKAEDDSVRGAAWKPKAAGLEVEKDIALETGHAKFLLQFLKTAKMFNSFDLTWAVPLYARLKAAL